MRFTPTDRLVSIYPVDEITGDQLLKRRTDVLAHMSEVENKPQTNPVKQNGTSLKMQTEPASSNDSEDRLQKMQTEPASLSNDSEDWLHDMFKDSELSEEQTQQLAEVCRKYHLMNRSIGSIS